MDRRGLKRRGAGRQLVLAVGLWLCVGAVAGEADYGELVRVATRPLGYHAVEPPAEMRAAAEAAMRTLKENESGAAAYILAHLQAGSRPRDVTFDPGTLGRILWRLGPEHVCALEPTVLQSPKEKVRRAGVYVLGLGYKRPGADRAVELLVRVLLRDKSPQIRAAAIRALDEQRAKGRGDVVVKYLSSRHTVVRRAAVGFFWPHAAPEVRPALEAMLETERDRAIGYWLVRTLAHYEDFRVKPLLSSEQPGIRQGALHALARDRLALLNWKPVVALIERERDPACRMQLAYLFARHHWPECIPLFIEALRWEGEPDPAGGYYTTMGHGACSKAAALAALRNMVGSLDGRVNQADRKVRGERPAERYKRLARLYEQWWQKHDGRVRWDKKRSRFVPVRDE